MIWSKIKRHTRRECAHRLVQCPHVDCGVSVQAHNLTSHFKYECISAFVKKKIWLIENARRRWVDN